MHRQIHAHTDIHAHTQTDTGTHKLTQRHAYMQTHRPTYTCTHTQIHMHADSDVQTHRDAHTDSHTQTHERTQTCTHRQTLTDRCTCGHTETEQYLDHSQTSATPRSWMEESLYFLLPGGNTLSRAEWQLFQSDSSGDRRHERAAEHLPLSHRVQNGPPCILNSFSERSLGVAGPKLSLRLDQQFKSKRCGE